MAVDCSGAAAAEEIIVVCLRLTRVPTSTLVSETRVLVTAVGTVNVSALLLLPTPKPVMKPGPASNGELQSFVVCAILLL